MNTLPCRAVEQVQRNSFRATLLGLPGGKAERSDPGATRWDLPSVGLAVFAALGAAVDCVSRITLAIQSSRVPMPPWTDQPAAALLADLKARGMLQDTLVVWGGEFGRTSDSQGSVGRDHNPKGFTIWMAGGGVKGGVHYGATDEFGYNAVQDKVSVHDVHATLLHQLGIDHERFTYRFQGLDMRLTGVEPSRVVKEILA